MSWLLLSSFLERRHLELVVTVHQQQITSRPLVCIARALNSLNRWLMLAQIPLIVACKETGDDLTSGFCFSVMSVLDSIEIVCKFVQGFNSTSARKSKMTLIVM